MPRMNGLLKAATETKTILTSAKVSLVVGTVLALINYGDRIFIHGDMMLTDWVKLALTYCVPFFVATYGAARYATEHRQS